MTDRSTPIPRGRTTRRSDCLFSEDSLYGLRIVLHSYAIAGLSNTQFSILGGRQAPSL